MDGQEEECWNQTWKEVGLIFEWLMNSSNTLSIISKVIYKSIYSKYSDILKRKLL